MDEKRETEAVGPKKFWFKRKHYGWGWVPATWQAWVVLLCFLAWVVFCATYFLEGDDVFRYFVSIGLGVVALLGICYLKGERPRWQWGASDEEDDV